LLAKAKGKLGRLLDTLTATLATRNGLPGLNSKAVTEIDTDRNRKTYTLTDDEAAFINGYWYACNTMDSLTQELSRPPEPPVEEVVPDEVVG